MNIEKTISEHAVSDILTPMLESQDRIVTEDVAPLFDQATGLDTPTASGTVTTTIEESRSVITAIIRKAWTATLTMLGGASVLSSIAAAYTYLRNRLQGNETYGIPDRRSEISASSPLAANLALLNDRKIGGVPEAADGMSLVHLLYDTSAITELTDDNVWDDNIIKSELSVLKIFRNLENLTLNCKKIEYNETWTTSHAFVNIKGILRLPYLTIFRTGSRGTLVDGTVDTSGLFAPNMEIYNSGEYDALAYNTKKLKFVYAPKMTSYIGSTSQSISYGRVFGRDTMDNDDEFRTVVVGDGKIFNLPTFFANRTNLIHIEIMRGSGNMLMQGWSPTNALDASRTDLIEEGSTAQNNLQQFLSNFRDYIANRLTDNGSGKTLTLSQAVRNAIHAAESTYGIENIIITQKGWTISPAPN